MRWCRLCRGEGTPPVTPISPFCRIVKDHRDLEADYRLFCVSGDAGSGSLCFLVSEALGKAFDPGEAPSTALAPGEDRGSVKFNAGRILRVVSRGNQIQFATGTNTAGKSKPQELPEKRQPSERYRSR